MIDKLVLIRTYSAGVHIGTLASHEGMVVKLLDARRLWSWSGANTLNEAATKGVSTKEGTRISEPVPEIVLTQAIEIIPISVEAQESLLHSRWN